MLSGLLLVPLPLFSTAVYLALSLHPPILVLQLFVTPAAQLFNSVQ
jgi:hypothetical protein